MKTRSLILALPIIMLATASSAAEDYPELKPGLWSSSQVTANSAPVTSKMCTNTEMFKMFQNGAKDPNRPCKAVHQTHTGSTYTAETECNFGGKIKKSNSVMTVTGDTGMHLEVHSDDGSSVQMDMKYLGACPADMVPGDFIMANGMRINILKGAANGAAPK